MLATPYAEKWIWESVPKEGRRRLRRIWAEQARASTGVIASELDSEE